MTSSDSAVVLALMRTPGMGNVSINRVMGWCAKTNHSLDDMASRPVLDLLEQLPEGMTHCAEALSALSEGSLARASQIFERTSEAGAQAILADAADYPEALHSSLTHAAPPMLFVLGDLDLLQEPCAGVVGTRKPSSEGLNIARECASVFAKEGVTVVSGGARGIDLAAHRAALDENGRTVVVLPQGLLTYRGPAELADALEEGRVVLVSEFVPDVTFSTHGAITRNGTIAALSRLICVIEPGATGGSVRTARRALELGRRVLVDGAVEAERTADDLVRAGAMRLREEDTAFDGGRMLTAWASSPDLKAGQAEMF